jgi:hypothetical protein
MSTRGCIAFAKEVGTNQTEWEGRYHHSDSYPTGLGRELWKQFREHFGGNFGAARQFFFVNHPAGFSTILGADLLMPCGYEDDYTKGYEKLPDGRPDFSKPLPHGARCFCHGNHHEKEDTWTDKDDTSDLQWLYVFADTGYTVELRVSRSVATSKKDAEGYSITRWQQVAVIDMSDSTEPDWERIECGKDLEYCRHVAEYHFPELSGTSMERLSVATFLGRESLDTNDVRTFKVGDHIFDYAGSAIKGTDPSGAQVWIASVKPRDPLTTLRHIPMHLIRARKCFGGSLNVSSECFDMIVGKYDKKGRQVPYRGVEYIYPPTLKEPLRVFAELREKFLSEPKEGNAPTQILAHSKLGALLATGRLFREE